MRFYKGAIATLTVVGTVSDEMVQTIHERTIKKHFELIQKYPDLQTANPLPAKAMLPASSVNHLPRDYQNALYLIAYIHWRRHGTSFYQDLENEQKDYEAFRRIARTTDDCMILHLGRGPIMPFQENREHGIILEMGEPYGLYDLTAEELARFFDKFCPCKKEHDPDTLKKQRSKLQRDLAALETAPGQAAPPTL